MRLRSIPPANRPNTKPIHGLAKMSLGRAAQESRQTQGREVQWKTRVFTSRAKVTQVSHEKEQREAEINFVKMKAAEKKQWWADEVKRLQEELSPEKLAFLLKELTGV